MLLNAKHGLGSGNVFSMSYSAPRMLLKAACATAVVIMLLVLSLRCGWAA